MSNNLASVLKKYPVFDLIRQVSASTGVECYVVGGFVRDILLHRPSNDIDIMCVGDATALARAVSRQAGKANQKHSVKEYGRFGTAMMHYEAFEIEFVGARKESYTHSSRKPEVKEGTFEDDINRRDFTINALAISLNEENFGKLIDSFNGLKDLKRRIIQTPLEPGVTFSDDPLRMMRAVRFATQLQFDIEPDTFQSIQDQSHRLSIISQERVTDELNKIILSPVPSYGFKLLFESNLLSQFFPEFVKLHGVETIDGKSHKDNFYHTLQVLDNVAKVSDSLWLRWAALLHDIAKPPTKRFHKKAGWTFHGHEDLGARMVPSIFRKMKLPLDEKMRFVQKLVKLHLRPIALVKDTVTDSAVRRLLFEAGNDVDNLMKLCRADITSKNHNRVKRYLQNFDKVEKKLVEVEEKDKVRNFQPPVSGDEIMALFSLKPSRIVGELKNELREAILDGVISNERQQAVKFIASLGEKKNLAINHDVLKAICG
jgi:poly(A) polymerase